ncbi:MAG TPA: hypothetical protein VJA94_17685 [Candidatus Angelobacter sp.]
MKYKAAGRVTVTVNGHAWKRVAGFDDAGPNDAVFVLNPQDGSILFGDGAQGQRPSGGATIRVSYRDSAGASGNISKRIDKADQANTFFVLLHKNFHGLGWGMRPR